MGKKNIRKDRKSTKHHLIPISRGGKRDKDNIIFKEYSLHQAWHILFRNKKPLEVLYLFTIKTKEELTKAKNKQSRMKKKDAWQILFGSMIKEEIIVYIIQEWSFSKNIKRQLKKEFL